GARPVSLPGRHAEGSGRGGAGRRALRGDVLAERRDVLLVGRAQLLLQGREVTGLRAGRQRLELVEEHLEAVTRRSVDVAGGAELRQRVDSVLRGRAVREGRAERRLV